MEKSLKISNCDRILFAAPGTTTRDGGAVTVEHLCQVLLDSGCDQETMHNGRP